MKTGTGGARAIIGAAIMAFVLAGCGGGGGSDSGGSSDPGPGAIKSADYWYEDPDTIAVFFQGAAASPDDGEILRMTPIDPSSLPNGATWGWRVISMSPEGAPRASMHADVRRDGVYTWQSGEQPELELPAVLSLGRRMESPQQSVYLEDELGRLVPALITSATTAMREGSLALSRFTVSDVIRVERDYRLVFPNDSNAVGVTKETVWYGRGLGPVKSEIGALVPEGQPIPVESVTELRGFRSPTRAIGLLPGVAAIQHEALIAALTDAPGTGVTSANASTRRANIWKAKVAAGDDGFMIVAAYSVRNPFGGGDFPGPSPDGGVIPADPERGGLAVMTADAAGRQIALRSGPVTVPPSIDPLALVFDGSRFWLLGNRFGGVFPMMFLTRISPDGQLIDDLDLGDSTGCHVYPSGDLGFVGNGESVVIASAEFWQESIWQGPMEPPRYEDRVRIRWCAYNLDRQLLVSGEMPSVEGRNPEVRLTVSDSGGYVISVSMTGGTAGEGTRYAEVALDAYGTALDTTPRIVAGRAPENFDALTLTERFEGLMDLERFTTLAPTTPSQRIATSGSGAVAIPHVIENYSRSNPVLDWSLLIPEQDGW